VKRRRVVGLVAAWVAVVALASSLAWFAIERAGREVLTGPSVALDVDGGTTAEPAVTTSSTPTARPTPKPASKPSSSSGSSGSSGSRPGGPSSSRPQQVSVDRSVVVTGGAVGVRCTGSTAKLRYAQPAAGYTVTVKDNGPQRVEVEFTNPSRGTRVRAECSAGAPQFSSDPRSGTGGGGDDGGGGEGGSGSGSSGRG
jgi:hypothetical protein